VIQEVTADLAESFGLKSPQGALIADVEAGSPAEKAGVLTSDIVLKFDGKPVNSSIDLPRLVGATPPGKRSTLTIWRKGEERELIIKIGEMAEDKIAAKAPEAKKSNRAGLAVSELTREQKSILKIPNGVLVDEASGPASRSGIQSGDIIVAVNNQGVNTPDELAQLLNDRTRTTAALLVKRGEDAHYVSLRLEK
jgi:serine protease Do